FRLRNVLTRAQVREARQVLEAADWGDGRASAGHLARGVKDNGQLAEDHPASQSLGDLVLQALGRHQAFLAAALPLKVLPPRFNRYRGGGQYGMHVDSAVFSVPGTPHRVRSDLSATLFLSEPDESDGGELVVADTYGEHGVRRPAGHIGHRPAPRLH